VRRFLALGVAVTFIGGLAYLTALEFSANGVTLAGVVGVLVLIVLGVGVLGAFLQPPRK
jgi:hypothetical protein